MHKVIVEEPRHGGGKNKEHRLANLPEELQPRYQGMRRPYQNRKRFGEHLGPLKRWLRSQVGRPWNDVYSEACEVIKPDNVVRAHIRTHMLAYVERNTFMRDGVVWCYMRWGRAFEAPISGTAGRWRLFYVHPATGLLLEIPRLPRPRKQRGPLDVVWLSKNLVLRKLNGLWFECQTEEFPTYFGPRDSPWRWDYAEGKMINRSDADAAYGARAYCAAKRQLSRRELKQHGLMNTPTLAGRFVTPEQELRTDRLMAEL